MEDPAAVVRKARDDYDRALGVADAIHEAILRLADDIYDAIRDPAREVYNATRAEAEKEVTT